MKNDRLVKQRKKNMPFLSWLVDASILSQSIFRLFGGGGMGWSVEGAKIKHQSIDDFLREQFFFPSLSFI